MADEFKIDIERLHQHCKDVISEGGPVYLATMIELLQVYDNEPEALKDVGHDTAGFIINLATAELYRITEELSKQEIAENN